MFVFVCKQVNKMNLKLLGRSDEDDASRGMQAAATAPPPPKRPKLFANYGTTSAVTRTSTCLQQIKKYVDMQDIDAESLAFWQNRQTQTSLDKLYLPALRALSVPASSAAVERVFSHGGYHHAATQGPHE